MSDHARAPFTQEQVNSLNAYQQSGVLHPFTCANNSHADLVATVDGWVCPLCDYTQDWAHWWMADYSWEAQQEANPYP